LKWNGGNTRFREWAKLAGFLTRRRTGVGKLEGWEKTVAKAAEKRKSKMKIRIRKKIKRKIRSRIQAW
jgi:hypothetical protein